MPSLRFRHLAAVAVAAIAAGSMSGAAAHHGWSGYDSDHPVTLTGAIKESSYEQPHGYVKLQSQDKLWTAVLAPPSRMDSRGLTRAMLAPGTEATVIGYPSRSDPTEMRAERITIGGKTIELR